jgi:hypothetical protein
MRSNTLITPHFVKAWWLPSKFQVNTNNFIYTPPSFFSQLWRLFLLYLLWKKLPPPPILVAWNSRISFCSQLLLLRHFGGQGRPGFSLLQDISWGGSNSCIWLALGEMESPAGFFAHIWHVGCSGLKVARAGLPTGCPTHWLYRRPGLLPQGRYFLSLRVAGLKVKIHST